MEDWFWSAGKTCLSWEHWGVRYKSVWHVVTVCFEVPISPIWLTISIKYSPIRLIVITNSCTGNGLLQKDDYESLTCCDWDWRSLCVLNYPYNYQYLPIGMIRGNGLSQKDGYKSWKCLTSRDCDMTETGVHWVFWITHITPIMLPNTQ